MKAIKSRKRIVPNVLFQSQSDPTVPVVSGEYKTAACEALDCPPSCLESHKLSRFNLLSPSQALHAGGRDSLTGMAAAPSRAAILLLANCKPEIAKIIEKRNIR